ncbi:hypothetical protein RJD28_17850 [Oscillospiraceae bacterium NTUH-002-81]|nr:hypothetical protein RJD28_17850 [Oscillospiraceae bacterium NTUH-002-81]
MDVRIIAEAAKKWRREMTAIGIVPFFNNVFVIDTCLEKLIAEQYVAVI